jgi:CheY-like chemotaxis protein
MTIREMAEQVTQALDFMAPMRMKVLLVDDSSDDCVLAKRHVAEAVRLQLSPTHIEMECESSPKEAHRRIMAGIHDLYIVDWTLRNQGDGIELIRDVGQQGSLGPFVVLSGMEDALREESQERMLSLNVMDFLSKDALGRGGINRCCRYAIKNHRLLQLARKATI